MPVGTKSQSQENLQVVESISFSDLGQFILLPESDLIYIRSEITQASVDAKQALLFKDGDYNQVTPFSYIELPDGNKVVIEGNQRLSAIRQHIAGGGNVNFRAKFIKVDAPTDDPEKLTNYLIDYQIASNDTTDPHTVFDKTATAFKVLTDAAKRRGFDSLDEFKKHKQKFGEVFRGIVESFQLHRQNVNYYLTLFEECPELLKEFSDITDDTKSEWFLLNVLKVKNSDKSEDDPVYHNFQKQYGSVENFVKSDRVKEVVDRYYGSNYNSSAGTKIAKIETLKLNPANRDLVHSKRFDLDAVEWMMEVLAKGEEYPLVNQQPDALLTMWDNAYPSRSDKFDMAAAKKLLEGRQEMLSDLMGDPDDITTTTEPVNADTNVDGSISPKVLKENIDFFLMNLARLQGSDKPGYERIETAPNIIKAVEVLLPLMSEDNEVLKTVINSISTMAIAVIEGIDNEIVEDHADRGIKGNVIEKRLSAANKNINKLLAETDKSAESVESTESAEESAESTESTESTAEISIQNDTYKAVITD